MPFTAIANRAYKDPITVNWGNDMIGNDNQLFTGVAKFYASWDASAATITSIQAFNVSNITDNGVGLFTLALITGFTSTGNMIFVNAQASAGSNAMGDGGMTTATTSTVQVTFGDAGGGVNDVYRAMVIGFGRQS